MKKGMFANALKTRFRVDWSWREINVQEIKEGIIKSLKPWKLGEELGNLHNFFSDSMRLGDALGCRHEGGKGVKV